MCVKSPFVQRACGLVIKYECLKRVKKCMHLASTTVGKEQQTGVVGSDGGPVLQRGERQWQAVPVGGEW